MSDRESKKHRSEGTTNRRNKWRHLKVEKDYVFYYQFSQISQMTAGKSTAHSLQKDKTKRKIDMLNVLS